jgi:hypothetical protein
MFKTGTGRTQRRFRAGKLCLGNIRVKPRLNNQKMPTHSALLL